MKQYLIANTGVICSRDELIEAVWGKDKAYEVSDHALTQLLYRLKRKIGGRNSIKILRGRGIKLI